MCNSCCQIYLYACWIDMWFVTLFFCLFEALFVCLIWLVYLFSIVCHPLSLPYRRTLDKWQTDVDTRLMIYIGETWESIA